jgi:hypothetical protein
VVLKKQDGQFNESEKKAREWSSSPERPIAQVWQKCKNAKSASETGKPLIKLFIGFENILNVFNNEIVGTLDHAIHGKGQL